MIKTRKTVKIDKPQKIPKEAIDKYFVANTAEIFVPDKVVSIDNEGKIKLVKTLSKNKNIKKIKGKPVIKIEDKNINGIVINQEGEKLINRSKGLINQISNKKLQILDKKIQQSRYDEEEYKKKLFNMRQSKNKDKLYKEYGDNTSKYNDLIIEREILYDEIQNKKNKTDLKKEYDALNTALNNNKIFDPDNFYKKKLNELAKKIKR